MGVFVAVFFIIVVLLEKLVCRTGHTASQTRWQLKYHYLHVFILWSCPLAQKETLEGEKKDIT